ncbi:MAG: hypothetical protein QM640_03230 [Niabella sp.]
METITLHPKTKEETILFEGLAKALKTPYEISKTETLNSKKKPSDYFGTLSEEAAEKMHQYVNESRNEWDRNI